ncbi:helix-turn-helix domain-containing protein [Pseudomonas sp. OTU750018]|nr:helix-turn-helix domain-containing protein [Pseudomonas sp. OTU750018]
MSADLYSKEAFAALVGVPVEVVAGWIKHGRVPSVKLGKTRLVRFVRVNP